MYVCNDTMVRGNGIILTRFRLREVVPRTSARLESVDRARRRASERAHGRARRQDATKTLGSDVM